MPIFVKSFLFFFFINGCGILSKAFSSLLEIIIRFLPFNLLVWYIIWIDLYILKSSYIPKLNLTWSWCMIFLMCCWILFLRILLRILACMLTDVIGLQFSFLFFLSFLIRDVFISFWYQGDGCLIEWVWRCSFLCNVLWKIFRIGISSSLMLDRFHPWSHLTLDFYLWESFDYSLDFSVCN